jgi:sortase A
MRNLCYKILITVLIVGAISGGIFYYYHTKNKTFQSTAADDTKDIATGVQVNSGTSAQSTEDVSINIASLSLSAPVVLNVDGNDKETYLAALENGVAHMKGTPLPGDPGNSVIFGHSSYYKDKPGNYKTIFATLNNLKVGDAIAIVRSGNTLNFAVTAKNIVNPDDVNVVSQDNSKKELTLITCWPVNTTQQRLVITAELK